MATEVRMPKLAMTMEQGVIVQWYKNVGDKVTEGQPLFSVETEKITSDVDSPVSGILRKIVVTMNEPVPCDTVVAIIVSLEEWENEGENAKTTNVPTEVKEAVGERQIPDALPGAKIIRLEGRKKIIADNTLRAWKSIPMYCQSMNADASVLISMRKQLMPRLEKEAGVRLTLTAMLVTIVAWGLRQYPELNAHLEGDELRVFDHINICISSATPQGLILPVVQDADKKSLVEISKTVRDLTERARANKLTLDDISGGTFTLNNVGVIGIETGFSIINPPQVAILGVGKIEKKPVVQGEKIIIAPIMNLFINVNHRACDGITSAEFLMKIKSAIESPSIMETFNLR